MSVSAPVGDTMPGAGRGSGGGLTHIAEALRPLAVPVVDLVLDPANARKHPERNLDAIAASLRRFGQRKPVVVQKAGMIVRAGNGTVTAARSLGWSHVAAVVVDEASVDATAFAIADNRTAELAEWDEPVLAGLLDSLPDEALPDTGFTEDDLRKLIASVEDRQITEDDAPEPLPDPVSRTGDLWVMGDHRLLCGDSTKAGDVEAVMGGEKAVVCLTDPPYSVNYDKSQEQRGGDKAVHGPYKEADIDPSGLLGFMEFVPSDVMVWSYPIDRHFHTLSAAYKAHGWELKKELVWVKDSFSFWMSAKYQQKHEPIMLAVRTGCPIGGSVPSNATTVLEYPRPKAHELHPTAKPIELWCELLTNHSSGCDVVYEPFSGSGTTIIAAEQLGRKCYAIEIEPRYVDVGVRRWQKLTGKAATLNGKTFAEVAAERGVTLPNE